MPTRVLVVDDRQQNLDLAGYLLRKWGCDVLVTADPRRAVALTRQFSPDLVLVDLNMPEMDGAEVLRALAADDVTRDTACALFSATGTPLQVAAATRDGAVPSVRKAVDPAEFLADVRDVLVGAGKPVTPLPAAVDATGAPSEQ